MKKQLRILTAFLVAALTGTAAFGQSSNTIVPFSGSGITNNNANLVNTGFSITTTATGAVSVTLTVNVYTDTGYSDPPVAPVKITGNDGVGDIIYGFTQFLLVNSSGQTVASGVSAGLQLRWYAPTTSYSDDEGDQTLQLSSNALPPDTYTLYMQRLQDTNVTGATYAHQASKLNYTMGGTFLSQGNDQAILDDISALQTQQQANTAQIGTNTSNITTLQSGFTALSNTDANLQSQITSNLNAEQSDVAALSGTDANLQAEIAALQNKEQGDYSTLNDTDSNLQSQVTSNLNSAESEYAALSGTDANLQSQITANQNQEEADYQDLEALLAQWKQAEQDADGNVTASLESQIATTKNKLQNEINANAHTARNDAILAGGIGSVVGILSSLGAYTLTVNPSLNLSEITPDNPENSGDVVVPAPAQ